MRDIHHVTVLVNPASANENGHKIWLQLQPHFEEAWRGHEIQVIETTSREQEMELARTIRTDLLVSLSGDGTVNDLTQGLMIRPEAERPVLAVIPIGSGNDIAKALGFPMNPWSAISRLPRAQRTHIDLGSVNGRYFLNTLSFGVDAAISDRTHELRKSTRRRGFILYGQAAVTAVFKDLKPHHYRLQIDNEFQERDLLICAIQNGPYYGGGFKIAPHALLDDNQLDICLASEVSTLKALFYLARIARGSHEKLKHIETRRARQIILETDERIAAQCDGESIQGLPTAAGGWHYEIQLWPQALEVASMR